MADGANGVPPAYTGYPPGQGNHPYHGDQQQLLQQFPLPGSPSATPQPEPGDQTVIVRDPQPMPNDYMAFAVIVTICCCLPLGIVAIIKSSEVRQRHSAEDYEGAENASREAKTWSIAGLVTGCVIISISAVLFFVLTILPVIIAASYYQDYRY